MDDFKNEGVVASSSWPFQVNLLAADKQPGASVFPEEGATGWADTTMMHVDSAHPNCAYMWLEHSLSAPTQAGVASWFGSVPAVPAACKGQAILGDECCTANGADLFEPPPAVDPDAGDAAAEAGDAGTAATRLDTTGATVAPTPCP